MLSGPARLSFCVRQRLRRVNMSIEDKILKECRDLAASVLLNYDKPELITEIWTTDDREELAQRLFSAAKGQLDYIGPDRDPEIVLRAVRYMGVHAIPPNRMSTAWFEHGLATLVVLACPFYTVGPDGEPFFEDLRRGMREAEKE